MWDSYFTPLLFKSLAIGVLPVAAVLLLGRRRRGPWLLLALGMLPLVLVYVLNPFHRIYAYHGMMHTSIVYQVIERGLPPENPWLAGEPLAYPWAYHLVIADAARWFSLPLSVCFAAVNCVCLLVTLIALYRVAALVTTDRLTRCIGVLLALFGMTPLLRGPLADMLMPKLRGWLGFDLNVPGVPVLEKFFNINASPIGVMCTALFLYSTLTLLRNKPARWWQYVPLVIALLAAGYFYPLMYVGLLACASVGVVIALVRHRRTVWSRVLAYGGCVLATGIVIAPYLLAIAATRAARRGGFQESWEAIQHNLIIWVAVVGFMLLLVLPECRRIAQLVWPVRGPWVMLLAFALTLGGMYAVLSIPPWVEYKFLMQSAMCFGILGSLWVTSFIRRTRYVAGVLLILFMIPFGGDMQYLLSNIRPVEEVVEIGPYLHHRDPAQAAMYDWIAAETPADSIFVDSEMLVPVLGRRSLLVGMHWPPVELGDMRLAGWSWHPITLLKRDFGYPHDVVDQRERIVTEIYSSGHVSDECLGELRHIVGQRPAFVVMRDERTPDRLAADPRFERVYRGGGKAVYRLAEPQNPGGS
ncbi:MAG: hypothetical protein JXO22_12220 [Phycisphaerae bacterium]|nr:hypothetical protein [Phycisphaerae bacterium]